MSIRLKLFLAALAYLSITIAVGLLAENQERQLNVLAINIYDNVVKSVDYTRKIQADFIRFAGVHKSTSVMDADGKMQLNKILDTLDLAIERALTEKTQDQAKAVRTKIALLYNLPVASVSPRACTRAHMALKRDNACLQILILPLILY